MEPFVYFALAVVFLNLIISFWTLRMVTEEHVAINRTPYYTATFFIATYNAVIILAFLIMTQK